MRIVVLAGLLAGLALWPAVLARPVSAQTGRALQRGDRVEVRALGHTELYAFIAFGDDEVILARPDGGEEVRLALSDVDRMRLPLGPRSSSDGAVRGATVGAMVGALAGLVYGVIDGPDECPPGGLCVMEFSAGEKAFGGMLAFGGLGALVGGVLGALAPGTAWQTYEPPVRVGVTPGQGRGDGVRLTATLRF